VRTWSSSRPRWTARPRGRGRRAGGRGSAACPAGRVHAPRAAQWQLDLLQAEATADLIDAGSPAQARRALHQLDRGLSTRLGELRTELLELEALIAYEIDFPEEDEGPVAPERVERAWRAARDRIARLLDTAPEGNGCGKAPCS